VNHHDHVNLLRHGIAQPGGVWADFGSGSGAFTLALRELTGADARIFSIDRDGARLREQERAFAQMFPASNVRFLRADFMQALALPPLDGIVMANALHFFKNKIEVLHHAREFLKPRGVLILVEYNVDQGNVWVPHPLSFETFRILAPRAGFDEPGLLSTVPSRFLHEFFSALTRRV
jgi:ubiquinone/menaquinone biosynthesis C-methylase UbiE